MEASTGEKKGNPTNKKVTEQVWGRERTGMGGESQQRAGGGKIEGDFPKERKHQQQGQHKKNLRSEKGEKQGQKDSQETDH